MKITDRAIDRAEIKRLTEHCPVTAILGPRQCGKTTLAGFLKARHYFDMENPRDMARLEQPQLTLEPLRGMIVIDEIQRKPELFPLLRYLVDRKQAQRFALLGSASPELIRHSSETLAGRIAYYELAGFRLSDIGESHWKSLWLKGGLPPSFLRKGAASGEWERTTSLRF